MNKNIEKYIINDLSNVESKKLIKNWGSDEHLYHGRYKLWEHCFKAFEDYSIKN